MGLYSFFKILGLRFFSAHIRVPYTCFFGGKGTMLYRKCKIKAPFLHYNRTCVRKKPISASQVIRNAEIGIVFRNQFVYQFYHPGGLFHHQR